PRRRAAAVLAAGLLGWAWGSTRLDAIDSSVLASRIGTAERAHVVVTGPPRLSRFDIRVPAAIRSWGDVRVNEPTLLKLPRGRAPPQGAILELVGVLRAPSH